MASIPPEDVAAARGTRTSDRATGVRYVSFIKGSTVVGTVARPVPPLVSLLVPTPPLPLADPAPGNRASGEWEVPQVPVSERMGHHVSIEERDRQRVYLNDPKFPFSSRLGQAQRNSPSVQQQIAGRPAGPIVTRTWEELERRETNWWLIESLTESAIIGSVLTIAGMGGGAAANVLKWVGRAMSVVTVGGIAHRLVFDEKPLTDREKAELILTIVPAVAGLALNRIIAGPTDSALQRFASRFRIRKVEPHVPGVMPKSPTVGLHGAPPSEDPEVVGQILRDTEKNMALGAFTLEPVPGGNRIETVVPPPPALRGSKASLVVSAEPNGELLWGERISSSHPLRKGSFKGPMKPIKSAIPTIVLEKKRGTPKQLWRKDEVKLDPAFSSEDDAIKAATRLFAKRARASREATFPHVSENELYDENGKVITKWWEISESQAAKGVRGEGLIGHTEQKALMRVHMKPGMRLKIKGQHHPCNLKDGCAFAMEVVAQATHSRITYESLDGAKFEYP